VVVEDKPTGKFVQFAASTQAPLVMDLPLSLLDESQQARAKDFFEGLGVHGESRPLAAKGRVSLTHQSWTINFDRDSKKAAERTIALFREVYQIPDDRLPDLSVEENLGD
jgi:hypothetical protein